MKSLFSTRLLAALALVVAVGSAALAQPGSGGPAPGTPVVVPTDTPVDGGASLLLAGGLGYALKKLRQRRKKA